MKKSISKFNILALSALFIFAVSFTACEEDPIVGCTDPEAENFDADADTDSGACSFARDKFIGSYTGMIECPGLLSSITSDMFPFEISESLTGTANEVSVLLTDLILSINGVIDGNRLVLNQTVPAYPFDVTGDGSLIIVADLTVTGFAELNTAETMMAGELTIEAKASDGSAFEGMDTCAFSGVKN